MSLVDWDAMTGPQVWAALRSAPKIAGPWEDQGHGCYVRRDVLGHVVGDTGYSRFAVGAYKADSKEEVDAQLRANGWRFADELEYGVWLEPGPRLSDGWTSRWTTIDGQPGRFTRAIADGLARDYNEPRAGNPIWCAEVRKLPPLETKP